jgi:hypothetical protein
MLYLATGPKSRPSIRSSAQGWPHSIRSGASAITVVADKAFELSAGPCWFRNVTEELTAMRPLNHDYLRFSSPDYERVGFPPHQSEADVCFATLG